jgi:hypothetical protein
MAVAVVTRQFGCLVKRTGWVEVKGNLVFVSCRVELRHDGWGQKRMGVRSEEDRVWFAPKCQRWGDWYGVEFEEDAPAGHGRQMGTKFKVDRRQHAGAWEVKAGNAWARATRRTRRGEEDACMHEAAAVERFGPHASTQDIWKHGGTTRGSG